MTQEINGATRLCCLFGDPVEHSRSPKLHNKAFKMAELNLRYVCFRTGGDEVEAAMNSLRQLNMVGCSLTMPLKIAVLPYLDEIDQAAKLVGAVNTVKNENGVLTGYNTDGYGFMKAFADRNIDVRGKKMVQMGMGGAGTAVAAQAAIDGMAEIAVFSPSTGKSWQRVTDEVAVIANGTDCNITLHDSNDLDDLRAQLANADILANATPLGMGKLEGQSPIPDASFLHKGLFIQDCIYSPAETALMKMGREAGCEAINGIEMLFWQGARSFEIWTGQEFPYGVEEFTL